MADKKPRVLLVEDNPGDAELIYDSLIGTKAADIEDFAVEAVRLGAQDYPVKGDVSPDALARSLRVAVERQVSSRAG